MRRHYPDHEEGKDQVESGKSVPARGNSSGRYGDQACDRAGDKRGG